MSDNTESSAKIMARIAANVLGGRHVVVFNCAEAAERFCVKLSNLVIKAHQDNSIDANKVVEYLTLAEAGLDTFIKSLEKEDA